MTSTDTDLAQLEAACAYAESLDAVALADVWIPTPDEIAEYAADGIVAKPRLLVTVWRSHRNPSDVKWDIACRFELECVSDGSGDLGVYYDFENRAA